MKKNPAFGTLSVGGSLALMLSMACSPQDATTAQAAEEAAADLRPAADPEFAISGRMLEGKDVSAVARNPKGIGIVASDEGAVIQSMLFLPGNSGARILQPIALPAPGDDEADIEGVAWSEDGHFYVAGSHSVSRKKGLIQESRAGVYRFTVDERTGAAGPVEQASLLSLVQEDPVLGPYLERPLQQQGFNIEGLAARGESLFFGVRSPNLDGDAFLIEVGAAELFEAAGKTEDVEGPAPAHTLHRVPLGPGLGIRSLESLKEGFLILAGNAGSEPNKDFPQTVDYVENRGYYAFIWNPNDPANVRSLGRLGGPADGKAEALLVLDESDDGIDFLVLYDGPKDGAPLRFRATLVKE